MGDTLNAKYVALDANDALDEGQWTEADGTAIGFFNWSPAEPNNVGNEDYVGMYEENGQWNDVTSSSIANIVCEQDKCDSCSVGPCNDGTCSVDGDSFTCACPTGQLGERCEDTPCTMESCNGGTCSVDGDFFICACPTGQLGERCEDTPCTMESCNGGTCSVDGDFFTCECPTGQLGETCEETPCTVEPCNGGTCSVVGNSYTCDCSGTGKVGSMCHEDCADLNIFAITCMNDFKIKVDVEKIDCFKLEYPTMTLNDLIVMATDESDGEADDTCKAFSGTERGSNYIYGNADLSTKVTKTSDVLYFDGKVCGSDAAFDKDSSTLVYEAKLGTYIHNDDTQMLFSPSMVAVPITCKYTPSVDGGAIALASLILDKAEESGVNKVEEAEEATSFGVTAAISIKQEDGTYSPLVEGSKVILGEEVKVTFTSSTTAFAIHVAECVAGDAASEPDNTLALVTGDCFQSSANGALAYVMPTSLAAPSKGLAAMTMNQFAFVDDDSTNPDLVFHMKCKVEIGESSCKNRRRQAITDGGVAEMIDVTYSVMKDSNHTDKYEVDDGIIVHFVETTSSVVNVVPFVTII